ncbi:MAG: hypothetical protein IAF08_17015 [Rhizobacter sp.]|nr:hypothetical protein [Chlorobiales bacterium]
MSICSIPITTAIEASQLARTCPTCRLKVSNQFLSKCPRCTAKLSLASLCAGCFQSGACHGDEPKSQMVKIDLAVK